MARLMSLVIVYALRRAYPICPMKLVPRPGDIYDAKKTRSTTFWQNLGTF
jgi:hypothetical protein